MEETKLNFFPKQMQITITEKEAKAFIEESKESMKNFLDWMFLYHDYTMSEYLEDAKDLFQEFILSGGTAE